MKTYKELADHMTKKLPALEAMIHMNTGIDLTGRLKLEVNIGRNGYESIHISSDDLSDLLSPLTRQIFSKINIATWGGERCTGEDRDHLVWINPKIAYEHPSRGTNGCDFIWANLWFDSKNDQWIPGTLLVSNF